jgi:hypothetical protein
MKFQKNDDRINRSGRPLGAKNRVNAELREWVLQTVNDNREQFLKDLQAVEPEKRLLIIEKLISFVLPKPQSIEVDLSAEYRHLERLLQNSPDEYIEKVTEKLLKLNLKANENEQIEDFD